jgi:D-arabinitol 4-dehydrogenase
MQETHMNSGQSGVANAHVILHIGAGSFHRAHQAWYLHRLNELRKEGEPRWSLTVGNIRGDMNPVLEALAAQGGVYTLETVTPGGERAYETVRSIERVVPWSDSLDGLIEAGADPACKIIAFTVTEGGYYLDEHDRLDTANPDLAADLNGVQWRPGDAAKLRQPAQQRRALSCGDERVSRTAQRQRARGLV